MSASQRRGFGGWSPASLEPRWSPDRPLAERITQAGRFASIDPTRPGRVWGPARWVGLAGWVLFVSAAYALAGRRARAVRSRPASPPGPERAGTVPSATGTWPRGSR